MPDSALYLSAEGYAPQLSRPLTPADDGAEMTFELIKASPVVGKVITPDGRPAAKAEVRLWSGQLNFNEITSLDCVDTDATGNFSLPQALDGEITVNHDSGFARVSWKQFRTNSTILLSKWGHVKGHWPKPWPQSRRVQLRTVNWAGQMFTFQPNFVNVSAEINRQGNFEFSDPVPPENTNWGRPLLCPRVRQAVGLPWGCS